VTLVHRRSVQSRSLVQGRDLSSLLAPADRDQTVSRRFEPSSRTALIGEQPNPWDCSSPRMPMSRHRGAKPRRRVNSGRDSLLSPEYFYPLSDGPSIQDHRITMTWFPTCSTVGLAVKLPCAIALAGWFPISLRTLRAPLLFWEATAHSNSPPPSVPVPDQRDQVRHQDSTGWYFHRCLQPELAPRLHKAPPILHNQVLVSLAS